MNITKTILKEEDHALIQLIEQKESELNSALDALREEQASLTEKLNEVKAKMRPLLDKKIPLAEMKAGIASKQSRVKYFPEFATRNFDSSKDAEFLEFVRQQLSPDKANDV